MTGHNSWTVGADLVKNKKALRYIDNPHKIVKGGNIPGKDCSIDNANTYNAYRILELCHHYMWVVLIIRHFT